MKQPSKEQLASLDLIERFSYRCADFCNQRIKEPLIWWNRTFMFSLIWFGLSRRLFLHGVDNIEELSDQSRVVIAANHRTFFDFFVITWITYTFTPLSKRIYFPVRSTFFYDTIIGTILNFFMGGFAMFPPIMRDKSKKIFNRYSIDRLIEESQVHPLTIGIHPEGTRNKDPDIFTLLPAKPGIGEILIASKTISCIPMYIIGPTNNLLLDFWRNWTNPKPYPIHIYIGKPVHPERFTEYDSLNKEHQQEVADVCMNEIRHLIEIHRQKLTEETE